ncbi:LOW QUALITY PROTEIN: hypothetical protein RJ639_010783 [Escallonia herrerae]|uniref:Peptidase metallopeptidase domain-containing protein n=1 Tax=Escallonia herrerae TaxID=1293975 RepID=A0AA89APW5_9ASTE|nr:LOW QUALITY PROTEIN: hypothetical protein RJ639_010783 [Escallonia herrerae]
MALKWSQLFSGTFLLILLLPLLSLGKEDKAKGEKHSSPFEFIEHLQGCHKGEEVKGLNELKKYLEKFGYLNYAHSKNQTHTKDDDFDDLLEAAMKTYQLNYHLKPTGTLDAQTVSKMMMSRCGCADIVNGTNYMGRSRKRHRSPPGSFRTVSHYAFFGGNPRWPASKYHLTYGFIPGTNPNAMSPVARAFDAWASATHFSFSRNVASADIKIGFHSRDHGDGNPFDGPSGILAHAWAPQDGRFHYDADERWSVGPAPVAGEFDLQTVALHEIGHLLGLGHSEVEGAIMWSAIAPGSTKGLHEDDIQGIRVLYNGIKLTIQAIVVYNYTYWQVYFILTELVSSVIT